MGLEESLRRFPVDDVASRRVARPARVEAASRRSHAARRGFDREPGLVRHHERDDGAPVASIRAKQAAAIGSPSRACRNGLFAWRRRRGASRFRMLRMSALRPSSRSASRIQPGIVATQGANSRARPSALLAAPCNATIRSRTAAGSRVLVLGLRKPSDVSQRASTRPGGANSGRRSPRSLFRRQRAR